MGSLEIGFARWAKNQMKCFMLNYTFQRENSHLIYAQLTWPVIMTFFPFSSWLQAYLYNMPDVVFFTILSTLRLRDTLTHVTQPRISISSFWQNFTWWFLIKLSFWQRVVHCVFPVQSPQQNCCSNCCNLGFESKQSDIMLAVEWRSA